MKRAFLAGLVAFGCSLPGAECGWLEQGDMVEPAPAAGRCARILLADGAVMARAPADGCKADEASACLILMPGETGQGFTPDDVTRVVGHESATRQEAALAEGTCPLTCP